MDETFPSDESLGVIHHAEVRICQRKSISFLLVKHRCGFEVLQIKSHMPEATIFLEARGSSRGGLW